VWGSLRGRAFAGIGSSSSEHKILSLKFDPELVAIDELYATIDNKV
jgi:septum formation inhibitor MinC